jgi:hypothetical protein
MAKNDRPLEVKPVIKYRAPKYPSHADPDPTRFPHRIPFPFRRELLSAFAAMGTSGCIAEMPAELEIRPIDPQPKTEPINARAFTGPNPFTESHSGLPHHASPYGTGQPAYMTEKIAREIIDRVFREEGFSLEGPVAYEREGVALIADGYDRNARVGYVFASWNELDKDAVRSWVDAHPVRLPEKELPRWLRARLHLLPESDHAAAETALKTQDHDTIFRFATLAHEAELTATANDPAKISMREIKALERHAADGEAFIAFISAYDRRFISDLYDNPDLRSELTAAYAITDDQQRADKFNELHARGTRAALERLEQEVRNYIAWARAQGL